MIAIDKPDDKLTIAVTRNLEHIYGIDLAIGAMPTILKELPNAELIVAGSGPLREDLAQQARSLGVAENIRFTGRLSRDEIATLYKKADLLLNPSRVDNSPNSLIEAMGCGVPIVSTRAGGIPQLVTHNTHAYLVDDYCADSLAQAAIKVLSDVDLQSSLRQHGLSHSEQFRWPQVKSKISTVYQKVIDPAAMNTDLYTKAVSNILFPLHERLKGHDSVNLRQQLESSQWKSAEEIEAIASAKLQTFIAKIYSSVPYYKKLF